MQFTYFLYSLSLFSLSSHLQSTVKAEGIQLLSLVTHKRRNNVGHVSGGPLYLLTTNLWSSPSSERVFFFFFLKLFLIKKKRERTETASAHPSCQVETELLSILGLWVCDSWELPSVWVISLKVAGVVTIFTSIYWGDVNSISGEFIFLSSSLCCSWSAVTWGD